MEKRVPEASALREFVHEQWEHVLRLIDNNHRGDEFNQQQQVVDAVENIVEQIDARIRGISNYKEQLRNHAGDLIDHVKDIVAGLPQAVTMGKNSYASEPLISAIFANSREIEQLVKESDEIARFSREHMQTSDFGLYIPDFYALLFVIKEQQQIFGSEIKEGILQRDVPQMALNFYGHHLVAPALNEQDARSALERILFDSTVAALRSKMVKLRHGQSSEESVEASLNPERNINNPEVYLKLLSEQLSTPENIISMQRQMIRISKMGIELSADSDDLSNELNFNEVMIGSSNRKVVSLVRVKYSEWQ